DLPQAVRLSLLINEDSSLSILVLEEISITSNCDTSFELSNNILSDETRVIDDIYSVTIQYNPEELSFTLLSADFLKRGQTSLWVISDGVNELFIGGTIHVLHETDFPLPSSFLEAYQLADTVLFELDPKEVVPDSAYDDILLPEGQTITQLFSTSVYTQINVFLNEVGYYLLQFENAKPEYLEFVLFYLASEQAGYGSGVDDFFSTTALSDFKAVSGLETVQEHFAALDDSADFSDTDLDTYFSELLAYIYNGHLSVDIDTDIRNWREGNIEVFANNNAALKALDPVYFEAILATRNRNWVPIIEQYLATPEIELILAGVGHFAGPDNVLQLLEELGYSVTRYLPQ
ncbi:MAG: hypothetical protein COC19_05740, partial [SAR86 cluster bacterium]